MKRLLAVFCLLLTGCAVAPPNLYQALGGQPKIELIVDNFIREIEFNPIMFAYFKDSDINRFRSKLIEHICFLSEGPCEYTGDSMVQVHGGMAITEADFNLGVDLLINAMNNAGVPHPVQNRLLAKMAPLRGEIMYQ